MVPLRTLTRIVAFAPLLLLNPHIAHAAPIDLPNKGSGRIVLNHIPDRHTFSELNPPTWCPELETRYEIHNTADSNVVIVKESVIKKQYKETSFGTRGPPSYEYFKRNFLHVVMTRNLPHRNVNENLSGDSQSSPESLVKGKGGDSHGKPAGKKAAISTDLGRNMKSQNSPEKVELAQDKSHQDPKGLQGSVFAAPGSEEQTGGNPQTGYSKENTGVPGQPGGGTTVRVNPAGSNQPDNENKKSPETLQKENANEGSTPDSKINTPPSPPSEHIEPPPPFSPSRKSNQDSTDPQGSTKDPQTSWNQVQDLQFQGPGYVPPFSSSQNENDKLVQVIDEKTNGNVGQGGNSGEQATLGNDLV